MNTELILEAIAKIKKEDVFKIARNTKEDSIKNRTELIKACQSNKNEEIERLLEIGVSANFLMTREGTMIAPLTLCARNKNIQGVQLLLNSGASDERTRELYEELAKKDSRTIENTSQSYALVSAFSTESTTMFSLLWEHMDNTELREEFVKKAGYSTSLENLDYLFSKGYFHKDRSNAEIALWYDKLMSRTHHRGQFLSAAVSFIEQYPEMFKKRAASVWQDAIRSDSWEMCQALARNNVGLGGKWTVNLKTDSLSIYHGYLPGELIEEKNRGSSGYNYKQWVATKPNFDLSVVGLAIRHNASKCLKGFLQVPALKEIFLSEEHGLSFVPYTSLDVMKVLIENGIEPALFKDKKGATPLHVACRKGTKGVIENTAKLYPEWIEARDSEQKSPMDRYPNGQSNRELVQSMIDKLAIKKVMGRGGSRKNESKALRRI